MKNNKYMPSLLLATGLLLSGFAKAQESINTSGGLATGGGGTVAYSAGQVVYTVISNNFGKVGQGVQQPFEVFTMGLNETESKIILSVFPNPTIDNFILLVNNYNSEKLTYRLLDLQGKLIKDGFITSGKTQIEMASLSSATYFIHVVNPENRKVQSFRIIKK